MAKKFELQNNERLKILRRRKGLTQKQMSEESGICISYISHIERDVREVEELPDIEPTELEICWILRMRNGLEQKELAEKVGLSRVSIVNMERGKQNPERLINYWRSMYEF